MSQSSGHNLAYTHTHAHPNTCTLTGGGAAVGAGVGAGLGDGLGVGLVVGAAVAFRLVITLPNRTVSTHAMNKFTLA